ncbi:hypothetical protein OG612_45510 (plasmid) [Streptomyces sp. NBC_01527]|uniref:hypothetical protein n=1 Tax=Streptomyces sp. NBC_01527 TaxID=2903894 RepID=UPI002F91571A
MNTATATLATQTVSGVAKQVAALLPSRRNRPWTVTPQQGSLSWGSDCVRLSDGARGVLVAQIDTARLGVFAEHPDEYTSEPDVVADIRDPDVAGSIAALLLRSILPRRDREADRVTGHAPDTSGWDQVLTRRMGDLMEVGFQIIDHGSHPQACEVAYAAPGLTWTTGQGGTWGLWLQGRSAHLDVCYDGPVSGLYGVLPSLLPPAEGRISANVGSVFTRHLTDRFPQLLPIGPDEVNLPGRREPSGFIALPEKTVPTDHTDHHTAVIGEFRSVGADLLLAAAPHLV